MKKSKSITESKLSPGLDSLLMNELIKINGKKLKKIEDNSVYQKLASFYPELPEEKKSLADLIISAVANLKNQPGAFGNLDYVNLLKSPEYDKKGNRQDYYQTIPAKYGKDGKVKKDEVQLIKLSPYDSEVNPIITLMHEGVHALDDLYTKSHQREMLDFLKQKEKEGIIKSERHGVEKILEDAQSIIPAPEFKSLYSYDGFFQPKIQKDFATLQQKNPGIKTFTQARDQIDQEIQDNIDPTNLFMSLSEFPAFAMENLFKNWKITPETNPHAKGFLFNMMQGVHRGLSDFELANYPLVVQGFSDRMAQLGESPISRAISHTPASLLVDSIVPFNSKKEEDEEKNPEQGYGPITRSKSKSFNYKPYG